MPNETLNVKNARISSHVVLFECTVQHDGWFPPQFLVNRSHQRRRKKSKTVPSSGAHEVGLVHLRNSST